MSSLCSSDIRQMILRLWNGARNRAIHLCGTYMGLCTSLWNLVPIDANFSFLPSAKNELHPLPLEVGPLITTTGSGGAL